MKILFVSLHTRPLLGLAFRSLSITPAAAAAIAADYLAAAEHVRNETRTRRHFTSCITEADCRYYAWLVVSGSLERRLQLPGH